MSRIFNKKQYQERRRRLRTNMTRAEVILWSQLKNRQVLGERFLRQYGVDRYVLDFYCPRLRLAIEVDGESHFEKGAERRDRDRQEFIEALGITFLRFLNTDIYRNLDGVMQTVGERVNSIALRSRGTEEDAEDRTPLNPPFVRRGDAEIA